MSCEKEFAKISKRDDHISKIIQHQRHLKPETLRVQRLQGLSNLNFLIRQLGEPRYVLKYFSPGIDRCTQNRIVSQLSLHHLAPSVIYANSDYRIERFIGESRHPQIEQMVRPQILTLILTQLHLIHSIEIEELKQRAPLSDTLFSKQKMQELMTMQAKCGQDEEVNQLVRGIRAILEGNWSKRLLPKTGPIVFCHNDLNNQNILLLENGVVFIDFQYASYNYLAYDLANFLNESCISYPGGRPGFKIVKRLSLSDIKTAVSYYPGNFEGLAHQVLQMLCVANLYWAIWSVKIAEFHRGGQFGVIEHGLARLDLFFYYAQLLGYSP